jgi:ABC-type transport system involved in cytochrome bd biosynthesis fused ATPase/permease subunit
MFLPQRPYVSLGTFREQITYPTTRKLFDDNTVRKTLKSVNLGHLEDRVGGMDARLDWTHVLWPGEQQRVAFARILRAVTLSPVLIGRESNALKTVHSESSLTCGLRHNGEN